MYWHVGFFDHERYEQFIADEVLKNGLKKQVRRNRKKTLPKEPLVRTKGPHSSPSHLDARGLV